ncbi:ParB/RepB/Spo0J family partition protein [Sulfitobacter sp. S190]|uniref:ParB/RepB/Spo0J family partition protein n=1 Tax=Sulfitobacter sp. S190 TaxID=2867022 RepID=UPI0021A4ECB3|nr:ParB/RepB/Spo0J family partition protein [Sulfitobacter sp. S190]UWR24552.1 ParB/RepB/Spo0J family partition protein [Sulfitobacter sp. S190]
MAKRRKLEAPNADDLARIEEEFRRETPVRGMGAPISQVAAETAQALTREDPAIRAKRARDSADAQSLRAAEAEGRLLMDLALEDIDTDAMVRDRTVLEPGAMAELQASIAATGLRLPIEVFELSGQGGDGPKYGLLSGYRRLRAMQALRIERGEGYGRIKAILRSPDVMGGAFAAMVEENEVRANLSHFERGRIAVIAAQQGAFDSVEGAVNGLFPVASKAKRSKIRSFAVIFEELGDLLSFPEALKEREGLRIAAALRQGAERDLRAALESGAGGDPASEWAAMEPVLARCEALPKDGAGKGGRPRTKAPQPGWKDAETLVLSSGITLRKAHDSTGYTIRFEGKGLDSDLMDSVMAELQFLLEKPE